ncbi:MULTISPECIES: methyl-accepting chemotaxis protein [Shewanella]|uniref:methyl-accepting chemotaxis protein n=1 Tax=Shewanella TaxID=22 RepID=UPI00048EBF24|nr:MULTISPECIES: methyl-accepting chemotaxis protein [Shewanella]QLE87106.1 methyl-accepting chemotaxis protein [Shewanella sp. Scap07]
MNLTLAQRLYAGFGIVILLMIIISMTMWTKSDQIHDISLEVEKDDVPGAILYLQVLDEMGDMHTNVLEYLNGETQAADSFLANYQEFTQTLAKLTLLESATQADRDKMAKIKNIGDTIAQRAKNEVFSRYDPDVEAWAFSLIKDLEQGVGVELESLLDSLKQQEFDEALNSTELEESLRDDLPGVRLYLELIDESGDMLASITSYTAGDLTKKAAFEKDTASFNQYLSQLKPLEQRPQEIANLQQIKALQQQIIDAAEQIFIRFDPLGRQEALASENNMQHTLFAELEKILDDSAAEEQHDAEMALEEILALLSSMIYSLIAVTIIGVVLAIVISYLLAKGINRRLLEVLNVARSISQGDLTAKPISETPADEIGALAKAMNSMTASLNQLLQEISQVASTVATSSAEIRSATEHSTASCHEQVNRTTAIATAAEQMSATVAEVAQQSAQASTNATESGDLASEGGSIVTQTVAGINQLSDMVSRAAETVDQLGKRSNEIGDVIQVIDGIAEQTNLLALNAAIEAARAGEQGRGFAVVADEVRTLASRTSEATQEVAKSIGAIQADTKLAISSIGEGTEQARTSVELAEQAGRSLETIVSSASGLAAMITSIATATEQQSVTTNEIAQDVTSIRESSNEVLDISNQTASKVEDMSAQAEQLESLVSQFKLRG